MCPAKVSGMKRQLALTALAALLPVLGCAAASDDGAEGSEDAITQATFDIDVAKNLARKVTEHDKGEFCAALKRVPTGTYSDDDTKKEDKLCATGFYNEKADGDKKAAVLCPKLNSTNAPNP